MSIEPVFLVELRRIIGKRDRGYQAEIGRALKIKPATLSNMINGRRGMDEDERIKIASFVGMDYESLRRQYKATELIALKSPATTQTANDNANQQAHSGAGNMAIFDRDSVTCTGLDDRHPPTNVGSDEWAELLYWLKRYPTITKRVMEEARRIGLKMDDAANG